MPEAISAQGTLVAREPEGGGGFTTITELRNITPPPLMNNPIETTSHNEAEESFVVGIRRKGEMNFTLGFVPSQATHDETTGLISSWINRFRDRWRVTFPEASVWTLSGYLTNFAVSAPVDDGLTVETTVRPTGVMSFA